MKKMYCIIMILLLLHDCELMDGQALQQLSYANADLAVQLIRTTSSTTTMSPTTSTTQKASFFSGIRNIFGGGRKTSTVAPTTLMPLSRDIITTSSNPSENKHHSIISNKTSSNQFQSVVFIRSNSSRPAAQVGLPILPTTSITQEVPINTPNNWSSINFPPLPPPRRNLNGNIMHTYPTNSPSIQTLNQVWSSAGAITTTTTRHEIGNFVITSSHSANTNVTHKLSHAVDNIQSSQSKNTTLNDEIESLTEALFKKDVNNAFKKIIINYQGHTQSSALTDEAPLPLFNFNESVLEAIPTVTKMKLLYNNYELDALVNEHVTPLERGEENEFLNALSSTSLMRHMMLFLQDKGKLSPDPASHRDLLKELWFSTYSRGRGKIGSSAFEHIFLTETKNGSLSGLHNWIYFYEEEKSGRADYKGYIKKLDLEDKGTILKYRFTHNNINKPVNTMFIGTTPELEIALYTLCFVLRADAECRVSLGGSKFIIRTYSFRYRGKNLIGSAYPEI